MAVFERACCRLCGGVGVVNDWQTIGEAAAAVVVGTRAEPRQVTCDGCGGEGTIEVLCGEVELPADVERQEA
jgi:hypothetical protein